MLRAVDSIFNQSLFQILPVSQALPTRFTGLPYRAFPKHEPHKYVCTPALGLGPSHLAVKGRPDHSFDSEVPHYYLVSLALFFQISIHFSRSPKGQFTSSVLLTGPCLSSLSSAPLFNDSPNHMIAPAIRRNSGHSELGSASTGFATAQGHSVKV
jgi:hypothetical protein